MKNLITLLLMIILLMLAPTVAFANSDWQTLKTEHFTVFYPTGQETEAWQVLQTLEYYRPQLEKIYGNEIVNFPVVIDDAGTISNGFTYPVFNQIHLFCYSSSGLSSIPVENWWSMVGVHEYTHELTLSKETGLAKQTHWLFGNLLMPNLYLPGWLVEGIAVYSESQIDPYQGRLNNGLYDAYIDTLAKDGKWPSILDATYSPLEFQLEGIYTFGSEFLDYLAKTYGQEKLAQFYTVNSSYPMPTIPALGFDRSARKVYGKSFPQLWKEWENYEMANHKEVKIDGEPVTHNEWTSGDPVITGNKLYYLKNYYKKTGAFQDFAFSEIIERDLKSGKEKVLVSAPEGFSLPAIKIKNGKLYYATNLIKSGFANSSNEGFGYLSKIHQIDLTTHQQKTLFQEGLRSFDIMEDGRLVYAKDRRNSFGSELYVYNPANQSKTLLFQSEYLIDEISSDQNRMVVSARRDWENDNLYLLDLARQEFVNLVKSPYIEGGILLQGNKLFFTANYNHSYGIYCYDFTSTKVYQATECRFAATPALDEQESQLYYMGLDSFGLNIYRKTLALKDFALPEVPTIVPPSFTLDKTEVTKGGYRDNLQTLAPKAWEPYVNIDASHNELGGIISGMDAINDFMYQVTLSYDLKLDQTFAAGMILLNYFDPLQAMITFDNHENNVSLVDVNNEIINGSYCQLNLGYPIPADKWVYTLGSTFTSKDDYQGLEIAPYISAQFQYPTTNGSIQLSYPEAKTNNDIDRSGFYGCLQVKQYLPDSQVALKFLDFDDPDNPDSVFPIIRGYDTALSAKQGQVFSLDYSRPLIKIRNGWWNPNIYFEDLIGVIFTDQAIPNIGDYQFSWGLEFHLETKTLLDTILPIDWGTRLVRNIDGGNKIEIFMKMAF